MEDRTTNTDLVVRLGSKTFPVVLPKRHADRRDLATAWVRSNIRGAGAILAFCVPGLKMLRSPLNPEGLDLGRYKADFLEFGADAFDLLLARGANEVQIVGEAAAVFNAIVALLAPTKDEVTEARDFS